MRATLFCIVVLAASSRRPISAQQGEGRLPEAVSYAPKPTRLIPYTPPHKPHTRLQDVTCLHFAWYNLVRIHRTLRVTPAREAGITDRAWELRELLLG
jgi:hypothetical protein